MSGSTYYFVVCKKSMGITVYWAFKSFEDAKRKSASVKRDPAYYNCRIYAVVASNLFDADEELSEILEHELYKGINL